MLLAAKEKSTTRGKMDLEQKHEQYKIRSKKK
jgi:hypothetical protein